MKLLNLLHGPCLCLVFLAGSTLLLPTTCGSQDVVARAVPLITGATPEKAPVHPAQPRKLLVFSVTNGYRHASIPVGLKAMEILGKKTGAFNAVISNDLTNFLPKNLRNFDAICFLNTTGHVFASKKILQIRREEKAANDRRRAIETLMKLAGKFVTGKDLERLRKFFGKNRKPGRLTTGEILKLQQAVTHQKDRAKKARDTLNAMGKEEQKKENLLKKSLMNFVRRGGGLIGLHAATDTYKKWPEYLEMIGGVFAGHPWTANKTVALKLEDPDHPINASFEKKGFTLKEEIYQIKGPYSRQNLKVLLRLDTTADKEKLTGIRGSRQDNDYAVSWIRRHGKGRVFYCSLGHNFEIFWNPALLRHFLSGIQFALGDLEVDAEPDAADPFMGEYTGTYSPTHGKPSAATAFVIPDGGGKYRVAIETGPHSRIEVTGQRKGDTLLLSSQASKTKYSGRITGRKISVRSSHGIFTAGLTTRTSKTLGMKPPDGAVVLLPFTGPPPSLQAWVNPTWKSMPDGSMLVGRGSNRTRQGFGDMRIHLEFRIPHEPKRRGQARGNSGVYLMDRYEIQVLDSFGLTPQLNDCGAIYKIAKPRVHACLPPLQWQTYDITFRTARFGPDGKTCIEPPVVTVLLNGRLIHDHVSLPGTTAGGGASKMGHGKKGPIMLQDHGDPLRFRNIWVVEWKDM